MTLDDHAPQVFPPDRVRSTTLCILVLRILRLHLDCHLLTCMPITATYLHIQHRQTSPQNYLRYFVKCREYLENARNLTIISNQTAKISFCRSRETVSVCGRHNCYGHSVQLVMNDQNNLLPPTTHLLRVSVTKTSPPETSKSSHDKSPPELTTPGSCSLPTIRVSKTMLVTPLLTLPVSTAGRNRLHWQDYATRAEPNLS